MKNFDYQTPTRLIFGRDVVAGLPEVMRPFGRRILLTYGGGSIKRIGLCDRVKELLKDFEIFELGGIEPNPKYSTSVVEGVRICKEQQIDVILSVGGGSVLDCSKAIAGGAKYDGETWSVRLLHWLHCRLWTSLPWPLRAVSTMPEELSPVQRPTTRCPTSTHICSRPALSLTRPTPSRSMPSTRQQEWPMPSIM